LEARVAWGWRLLTVALSIKGRETSFSLRLAGIPFPVPREKPEAVGAKEFKKKIKKKIKKKTGRKEKKNRFNFSVATAILNRKFLEAVWGYCQRLIQSFRLRLRLSGVYGTDDPALTGLIAGLIAALHAGHINLNLEADFSGPTLDLTGETSGRIVPAVILWFTIRFLLAEPLRKLWWSHLKTKLIRRKPKEGVQYV
jgi:hypothetical protein